MCHHCHMVTVPTFGQVLLEINAYRSRRFERLASFGWMLLILVDTQFFLDVSWHCGQAWVAVLSVWQAWVCIVFLVLFSVMRCRVDDVTLFEKQFGQMKFFGCSSSRPRFTSYVTKSSTNIQTTSSSRSVHLNKCWICAVISASTSKLQPPRQACKAHKWKNVNLRHPPDAHDRSAQIRLPIILSHLDCYLHLTLIPQALVCGWWHTKSKRGSQDLVQIQYPMIGPYLHC